MNKYNWRESTRARRNMNRHMYPHRHTFARAARGLTCNYMDICDSTPAHTRTVHAAVGPFVSRALFLNSNSSWGPRDTPRAGVPPTTVWGQGQGHTSPSLCTYAHGGQERAVLGCIAGAGCQQAAHHCASVPVTPGRAAGSQRGPEGPEGKTWDLLWLEIRP